MPQYCSFLIRVYRTGRGGERIEIEHIQSGAKTRVASETAALTWIHAQSHEPAHDTSPLADAARKTTTEIKTRDRQSDA